ncbi:hypothetical protein L4D17_19110 [Vibrio splendidus]|jgi:hypothetical protein|uniref:hypothetical protein n=1 Tax=Vibrio splendidus TaxID=29497 RepID=UPI0035513286
MSKYIYVVCLSRGRSHPQHDVFYRNVEGLNAKSPDFGGINNMCIIAHHLDAKTIHMLCSDGIKNENDVTVEEITKETLNDENSHHRVHTDLINNYFLPYGQYPNVK